MQGEGRRPGSRTSAHTQLSTAGNRNTVVIVTNDSTSGPWCQGDGLAKVLPLTSDRGAGLSRIAYFYILPSVMCPPGSASAMVPAPSTMAICRCGRVSLFQVTGPCLTPSGTYRAEVVSKTSG